MQKTIFLFTRKSTRSREGFGQHYIDNHAPLGKRLTRGLLGYTVNLVEGREWPDAVTEHWVAAATDIVTPTIAYASPRDFEEVLADDRSLFDGFELYVISGERELVTAPILDTPLGQLTPEGKAVFMFADADHLPAPPAARRVVDNFVSHKLVNGDGGSWQAFPSDIAVFRMAWGISYGEDCPDDCLSLKEYRQLSAPGSNWGSD